MSVRCSNLLLLCNPSIFVGAVVNRHSTALHTKDAALGSFELETEISAELRGTLDAMVGSMIRLEGKGPNVAEAMRTVASKIDVKAAAQKLEHKNLPQDVASLVRITASGMSTQPFSEASLDKARVVLNGMVEASWKEMDDKIIECKEFEEQNRGTFAQVTTDISRLVEQISDLQRIESESINGGTASEQEISDVEASLAEETKIYQQIYAVNSAEMVVRQNDLDVFTFILQFTKCADATSLLQNEHGQSTRICQTHSGKNVLHFKEKEVQHKYDKMLSPRARKLVSELLGAVQSRHVSLLQVEQPMNTTTAVPPPVVETPVSGEDGSDCMSSGDPADCMKSCPPTPPDCGLLHDKLSLMWGDYKDKVDELQMEMNKNQYEFEELKFNLNDQLRVLTSTKSRFSMQLAESRSNMAADREEKKEKEGQKRRVGQGLLCFHEGVQETDHLDHVPGHVRTRCCAECSSGDQHRMSLSFYR